MGIIVKEGVKSTVTSYIGASIGAIITLFIYPYFLTPEEVGLMRLLLDAASIFSLFASLGVSNILIKFFPTFKKRRQENIFLSLCFLLPLFGTIFISIIIILFSQNIIKLFASNSPLFSQYFYYTIPLTLATIALLFFESIGTIYRRIFVSRFIRDILIRLLTILIIVAYFFHVINLTGFVVGLILVYSVAALANFIYFQQIGITHLVRPSTKILTGSLKWDISKFGGNTILAGIGGMLVSKIDVLLISSKIGLNETGIFTIAFFIATMIEIPARSINSLVVPQMSTELHNNNLHKVQELYKKVTQNQLLISGTLLLLIWINIDNLFSIMPNGNIYNAGKYVVLFIGLGKLIDLTTGINSYILNFSKYYYLSPLFATGLGIIAIIFNIILIPRFGIVGAAIASLCSFFLSNCITVLLVQRLLHMQPFTWICLRITTVLFAAFGISLLLPNIDNPYISFIVQTFVVGFFIIFATMLFKLSNEAVEAIRMVMEKIRGKRGKT